MIQIQKKKKMSNSWQKITLGECLIQTPDYGINAAAVAYSSELPTYLRITDINEDGYFINNGKTSVANPNSHNYFLQENNLVIARTGASVGKTYLYNPADGPLVFAGFLIRIVPDNTKLLSKFLFQLTRTKRYLNWVKENSTRSGQPGLNSTEISDMQIYIPPIQEQNRIVKVLETWDKAIDSVQNKIKLQRNTNSLLADKLLSGALRIEEYSKPWKKMNLGEVADQNIRWSFTGGPFGSNLKAANYTKTGIRIIQLQNIGDGIFIDNYKIYTSEKKADSLLSCNIYPGEIILSKMGDPVARACIIPNTEDRFLMASDGIRLVVDKHKFNTYFIYSYINSANFRNLAEKSSTGSTRKRIGLDVLRNLLITVPDLEEQTAIAEILTTADKQLELLQTKLTKLKVQKKYLLNKLITGEIRTPKDL